MSARDFCYWLQGFFEINHAGLPANVDRGLIGERVKMIEQHLSMVFAHDIDPKAGGSEVQKKLNDMHGPNVIARC